METHQTWRDYAACTNAGIDFFHLYETNMDKCKTVCAGCSVQGECLDAGTFPRLEVFGIWGGEDPRTRKRLHDETLIELRKEFA